MRNLLGIGVLAAVVAVWTGTSWATDQDPVRTQAQTSGLGPLGDVSVPRPSNLDDFVKNEEVAIALGKALFWDMQVGSDTQACASCHFAAGADDRVKNQLTPGLLHVNDDATRSANPDLSFGDGNGQTGSGGDAGPNYTLVEDDYPFHRLSDPGDRSSDVLFDTNDATSSQGTFNGGFVSVPRDPKKSFPFDRCGDPDPSVFGVDGIATRKVEPRNTPTMINAVFNHRNFWDGRASNIFNGLNPLGERGLQPTSSNPNPGTLVLQSDGTVTKVQVRIDNASLASQSVGPPLSDFEMSCAGRTFADLGRKLRVRTPLAYQQVHREDSVLGSWRKVRGKGLRVPYQVLIAKAFENEYWAGPGRFDANGDPVSSGGYTQMEVNFPLFFGLAIQLYEATLVSDDTRFDQFMAGDDSALDEVEKRGLSVFVNEGKCINCHNGAEFTGASVRLRANQPDGDEEPIERMVMGDGGVALYDGGFYNIGVRPTFEDLGVGGELAGFPLSFARQESTGNVIDDFDFDTDKFEVPGPIVQGERVAVDGAFKVAGLRNVELTGPYFHNGGQATLSQVVAFYDRGGDRRDVEDCDTTRFGENCSNLDPDIQPLGLSDDDQAALVAFLLTLTDDRVRHEEAPFDHPQLLVPDGHPGDTSSVTADGFERATQTVREIPAVGADGRDEPLGTFLDLEP